MKNKNTTKTIRNEVSSNPSPLSSRTSEARYQNLPLKYRPIDGKAKRDPIHYESHLYPSMKEFAQLLTLRYDSRATRHSYYRQLGLLQKFCQCDPATITESQLRDYILYVKTIKNWKSKTIRQGAAAAKLFFVEMLGREEWKIFSQIRTKDQAYLPPVLTRDEIKKLLEHIRLRRYRIPIKLIYCCGLRLSECLSLTIHDIKAKEGKLWIRSGKGGKDRMVPIAQTMIDDLRRY